jgi:hypothetical protein
MVSEARKGKRGGREEEERRRTSPPSSMSTMSYLPETFLKSSRLSQWFDVLSLNYRSARHGISYGMERRREGGIKGPSS